MTSEIQEKIRKLLDKKDGIMDEPTLVYLLVEIRKYIEKLVTTAKNNNLKAQREVQKIIKNRQASKILFEEISPKYLERNGGYTRIIKTRFRKGDAAPLAVIEFIE